MEDNAHKLFDEAVEKLNVANQELFRPEEDIVSILVCRNAQFAIENFLKGFLVQNDVDVSEYKTIDSLYEQCLQINEKFENVDLSSFNCTSHELDSNYCDEVTKVSNCYKIADKLDSFLRQEKIIA